MNVPQGSKIIFLNCSARVANASKDIWYAMVSSIATMVAMKEIVVSTSQHLPSSYPYRKKSKSCSYPDNWQCDFDEYQCEPNGRCIPLSWKCDGRAQCPQRNDERDCHQDFCKNNEFQCVQQDTCIPLSWRCDGKGDCLNDEDEKLCGK